MDYFPLLALFLGGVFLGGYYRHAFIQSGSLMFIALNKNFSGHSIQNETCRFGTVDPFFGKHVCCRRVPGPDIEETWPGLRIQTEKVEDPETSRLLNIFSLSLSTLILNSYRVVFRAGSLEEDF